jgi:hypothetical protein
LGFDKALIIMDLYAAIYFKRKKFMNRFILLTSLLCIVFFGGKSMAFGKVSLCSKVEGVILRDGAPVENVKVKRNFNWHWGNKKNS